MKITFKITYKNRNSSKNESIELPYSTQGYICDILGYGDIANPEIQVTSLNSFSSYQPNKYLFYMTLYWSSLYGFKFKQYTDKKIVTSFQSPVGSLRAFEKIQINNNVSLIFDAEVNQKDLDESHPQPFIESCKEFGIKLANVDFIGELNLSNTNYKACRFSKVRFIGCNLKGADFSETILEDVKFLKANLSKSKFDKCKVVYDKLQLDNGEVLVFKHCVLKGTTFLSSLICSHFEDSDLLRVNFSGAKLKACKFYSSKIYGCKFTNTRFEADRPPVNKSRQQIRSTTEIVNCVISSQPETTDKCKIKGCYFDGASMKFIDISNTDISATNFENADLRGAKFLNCSLTRTDFASKTLAPANLSGANLSGTTVIKCDFNEVNFSNSRIIGATFKNSKLVQASFYKARLRSSQFIESSNLTGVDFREADLTLVKIDSCTLNCANFFRTQRGGLDLGITESSEIKQRKVAPIEYDSTCEISCIDWNAERDGEFQISKQNFLSIVLGESSASTLITELSKEAASIYVSNYNNSVNKNAQGDQYDSSINAVGNNTDSQSVTGKITKYDDEEVAESDDEGQEDLEARTEYYSLDNEDMR